MLDLAVVVQAGGPLCAAFAMAAWRRRPSVQSSPKRGVDAEKAEAVVRERLYPAHAGIGAVTVIPTHPKAGRALQEDSCDTPQDPPPRRA